MTRAAMLDVLGEDYVRTARAKGISETGVLLRHALRNAAVPVITVIGSGFALLISGVVVTESVFNLPGIGRLTVDAVLARDYPVIQAMILLTSGIYVAVNLLIDVAYTLLDPRIRYTDGDRNPPRTVDTGHHAVPAAPRISHLDADHRGRHRAAGADRVDRDPGAVAGAARSAIAGAGATAEAEQRAVPARHRRLWPRRAVAHHLWRPGLAA